MRRDSRPITCGALGVLLGAASAAQAEPAVGQFELKDLEAEPGEIEFQSQNAWTFGNPRRRVALDPGGEPVFDTNAAARQRHALELEFSLTRWLRTRVGIEFEKERLDDPPSPAAADAMAPLQLTEIALEGVVILKPVPEGGGVGFGVLAEFEHALAPGEMHSINFGPIVAARWGEWQTIANIMLVHHFGAGEIEDDGGVERDDKWDLAYALQLKYDFDTTWALALEAYGTFDRLGETGQRSDGAEMFGDHDQHRAGPIVYYSWRQSTRARRESRAHLSRRGAVGATFDDGDKPGAGDDDAGVTVTFGTGLLFGLNDNTPDATLKASLEVEF
ncbi:MAG: hypothetical protein ACK4MF_07070 [Hyphomicrobiaceae bacterium]